VSIAAAPVTSSSTTPPVQATAQAPAATTALAASETTIPPGSGSLTDVAGNVWTITASGSIEENGQYTPGGGGTSALTIIGGTVEGEDSSGRGWFALSGNGQDWASTLPPANQSATARPSIIPVSASPAPAAAAQASCAATPNGAATGQFTTANGQIYAPDGSVFIARGVDVMEGNEPSLSTLQANFPGVNFVRYAIFDYASSSTLSGWINTLTAAGIVVEPEDHNNGAGNAGGGQGVVFTGQQLATELAWYTDIATAFKSNPAVWFGTNNEPSENPSAAALSTWQGQTYAAIRATGNTSPIMIEANGGAFNGQPVMLQGYTPSVYAGMVNVIWDVHYYGWLTNYSTDQPTNNAFLAGMVQQAQALTPSANGTIPVLVGEYGNSTSGVGIDPNGNQVLTAVQSSGYGSGAWAWGPGNPGDGLSNGGNGLSSYGQEVAGYIALTQGAAPSVWATNCPTATVSASPVTVVAANTANSTLSTASDATPTATAPPVNSAVTAGNAQAQQDIAQGDALIQQSPSAIASAADDPASDAVIAAAAAQAAQAIAAMSGVGK
jgi:hypothetical protein